MQRATQEVARSKVELQYHSPMRDIAGFRLGILRKISYVLVPKKHCHSRLSRVWSLAPNVIFRLDAAGRYPRFAVATSKSSPEW